MDNFIEKMRASRKHKEEFIDQMTYTTDYIDWLERFTAEHGSFSTDSFLYDDTLSEEDRVNVSDVQLLYEEVERYCEDNFLVPTKVDYGVFYSIKHNGVGYFIGVDVGQGTSFYCTRLDEPEKDALEYKHLMSGVKLPKTVRIEHRLEELADLIEQLSNDDVPEEAIHQTADAALQKIRVRKQRF